MLIDSVVLKKALHANKRSFEAMRETFLRIGDEKSAAEQNGCVGGVERAIEIVFNMEEASK